jgi:hypothetical protein
MLDLAAAVASQGLGGLKRRPLSVVPDLKGARVNIKKLPLISHKAAANWTDALKVLAA